MWAKSLNLPTLFLGLLVAHDTRSILKLVLRSKIRYKGFFKSYSREIVTKLTSSMNFHNEHWNRNTNKKELETVGAFSDHRMDT